MTKKILAIWAQDRQGVIGKDERLPWHLPAELKHFKAETMGHTILMGRVTFDGMGRRLLPGRQTIVLSQNPDYHIEKEGLLILRSVQEVLDWYAQQDGNLYIIGGAQMFTLFEEHMDGLIETVIDAEVEGDTFFPQGFDRSAYMENATKTYLKDADNIYDFTIYFYDRKGR